MINGSCVCGAVTYEIKGTPKQINICHCKMCQKFSGSAFGSFMRVMSEDFTLTKGKETVFESSPWAKRTFCSKCGSSLRYINNEKPEYKFVATGTLDTDPGIRPKKHIFVKDKADWYEITDHIPQFPDWKSSVSPDGH